MKRLTQYYHSKGDRCSFTDGRSSTFYNGLTRFEYKSSERVCPQ